MDITSLKSGFWGYKKSSVCEYIAGVNEEFSHKLMDTLKDYDRQIQELNAKISQLEEENAVLRKERDSVTKIMTDAKAYSDDMRARAEAEDKKFRDNNMEYNKRQLHRIDEFGKSIDSILYDVRHLLDSVDKDLSENKLEFQKLKDEIESAEKSAEVNRDYEEL